jgi:hypothetical protein
MDSNNNFSSNLDRNNIDHEDYFTPENVERELERLKLIDDNYVSDDDLRVSLKTRVKDRSDTISNIFLRTKSS